MQENANQRMVNETAEETETRLPSLQRIKEIGEEEQHDTTKMSNRKEKKNRTL